MLEQEYYDALWVRVQADTTDNRNAQQRLQYVDTNTNGINEVSEQTTANLNNASNSNAVAANYYVASPITIASRNAAYSTESGKRMAEETSLRGLVAAREAATAGVVEQFTNARSFYQQLVDRRDGSARCRRRRCCGGYAEGVGRGAKGADDHQRVVPRRYGPSDRGFGLGAAEDRRRRRPGVGGRRIRHLRRDPGQ